MLKFICIFFILETYIENRLVFDEKIVHLTVIRGQIVYMNCHVEHLGGYKIGWIKFDTKVVQAVDTKIIIQNNRTKIAHWHRRIWTLQISNVQLNDSGQYLCQINTLPIKNQIFNLKVVIAPRFLSNNKTNIKIVLNENENNFTNFGCKVHGHPLPKIEWYKDNAKINFSIPKFHLNRKISLYVIDESVSLKNVNRYDIGHYFCYASNGISSNIIKRFSLLVYFKPKTFLKHDELFAQFGDNITLQCNIVSSPQGLHFWTLNSGLKPLKFYEGKNVIKYLPLIQSLNTWNIFWIKDSKLLTFSKLENILSNNSKYTYKEVQKSEFKYEFYLTIHHVDTSDFGTYECIAKNPSGYSRSSMLLLEKRVVTTTTFLDTRIKNKAHMTTHIHFCSLLILLYLSVIFNKS